MLIVVNHYLMFRYTVCEPHLLDFRNMPLYKVIHFDYCNYHVIDKFLSRFQKHIQQLWMNVIVCDGSRHNFYEITNTINSPIVQLWWFQGYKFKCCAYGNKQIARKIIIDLILSWAIVQSNVTASFKNNN